jgi:hypothetical protein
MIRIEPMLRSHPHADQLHSKDYGDALAALAICAETCTACADACLAENGHIETLQPCITVNLQCADICTVTARILVRQTKSPSDLVHAQLHACVIACQICADECAEHATMHEHCRICSEVCRVCQERCNFLLGEISSSGVAADETLP